MLQAEKEEARKAEKARRAAEKAEKAAAKAREEAKAEAKAKAKAEAEAAQKVQTGAPPQQTSWRYLDGSVKRSGGKTSGIYVSRRLFTYAVQQHMNSRTPSVHDDGFHAPWAPAFAGATC